LQIPPVELALQGLRNRCRTSANRSGLGFTASGTWIAWWACSSSGNGSLFSSSADLANWIGITVLPSFTAIATSPTHQGELSYCSLQRHTIALASSSSRYSVWRQSSPGLTPLLWSLSRK
jgi:hypothetical protein